MVQRAIVELPQPLAILTLSALTIRLKGSKTPVAALLVIDLIKRAKARVLCLYRLLLLLLLLLKTLLVGQHPRLYV
jgi:hypothetical protein